MSIETNNDYDDYHSSPINENNQINEEYLLNQETHPHIHICSRRNFIQHNAAVICNILTVKQTF